MLTTNIAIIVEATSGGVARHVIDLVTHFDSMKFKFFLYLSFERPESLRGPLLDLSKRGITIREVSMARIPNTAAIRQIGNWLRQDAIDIVHVHSAKAGYIGRVAAFTKGIPVIYTPHAFPFQRTTDWLRPIYRIVERRMAAKTDRIICVSAGEAEEALAARLPGDKLSVIPNGIDIASWPLPGAEQKRAARAKWSFAENEIVIGSIARLVPQKGIDLLLPAVKGLLPDFPQTRMAVWGDGPLRRTLENIALTAGIKNVSFFGEIDDPREAYAAIDIFCAPSRWEAGPYAVLEAMACGLPIVASNVAGHVDYLQNGVSGLIVNADPSSLKKALHKMMIYTEFRRNSGEFARNRVTHEFTIDKMVASTAELYSSVLARN